MNCYIIPSCFALVFALFARSVLAITIATVPVGDPGNSNDPATGNLYGGVNKPFRIGKYEVTVGQYTAFLNAVARTDTYALYSTNMATVLNIAGIARNGSSGAYTYSVIGSPNHPIAYISWGDAARFANWLHNGQPTGAQNATTTEDGAYTLNGATTDVELSTVSRNANAKWFIPSESEWYKAAYYQPASQGGDADSYWAWPMRTNRTPYSDKPPGSAPDNTRVGNFYKDDGASNGYDDGYAVTGSIILLAGENYLTNVGAYTSSPSFYGTFDQGGNVWEWTEAFGTGSLYPPSVRVIRGGAWVMSVSELRASYRDGYSPAFFDVGFRVATIPEPTSGALLVIAAAFSIILRRRKPTIRVVQPNLRGHDAAAALPATASCDNAARKQ